MAQGTEWTALSDSKCKWTVRSLRQHEDHPVEGCFLPLPHSPHAACDVRFVAELYDAGKINLRGQKLKQWSPWVGELLGKEHEKCSGWQQHPRPWLGCRLHQTVHLRPVRLCLDFTSILRHKATSPPYLPHIFPSH